MTTANNNTKNTASTNQKDQNTKGTQGGTHEQHVKAGQQSHKNSDTNKK